MGARGRRVKTKQVTARDLAVLRRINDPRPLGELLEEPRLSVSEAIGCAAPGDTVFVLPDGAVVDQNGARRPGTWPPPVARGAPDANPVTAYASGPTPCPLCGGARGWPDPQRFSPYCPQCASPTVGWQGEGIC